MTCRTTVAVFCGLALNLHHTSQTPCTSNELCRRKHIINNTRKKATYGDISGTMGDTRYWRKGGTKEAAIE